MFLLKMIGAGSASRIHVFIGLTRGLEFVWTDEHQAAVYLGRAISNLEFNEVATEIFCAPKALNFYPILPEYIPDTPMDPAAELSLRDRHTRLHEIAQAQSTRLSELQQQVDAETRARHEAEAEMGRIADEERLNKNPALRARLEAEERAEAERQSLKAEQKLAGESRSDLKPAPATTLTIVPPPEEDAPAKNGEGEGEDEDDSAEETPARENETPEEKTERETADERRKANTAARKASRAAAKAVKLAQAEKAAKEQRGS